MTKLLEFIYFFYLIVFIDYIVLKSSADCDGVISDSEYNGLKSLYYSTNGDNWCWHQNNKLKPWNFTTYDLSAPCKEHWQGVICGCIASSYIDILILQRKCLDGTIPSEIGGISKLVHLQITHNIKLKGSIPDTLSSLIFLEFLYFNGNRLTSAIPESIYSMTRLIILDLSFNHLTGHISNNISNLVALEDYIVSNNSLSGSIPNALWQLSRLITVSFNDNIFTGKITMNISDNTIYKLNELSINDNYFTSSFPNEISYYHAMTELVLDYNHFSSTLPSSITTLSNLEFLNIAVNYFTSTFPPNICILPNITAIALSVNYFSNEICFNYINASTINNNNFTDDDLFTANIEYGPNLQLIVFNNNQFTSSISSNICNWKYISGLYLSYNLFSGSLPSQLGICLPYIEDLLIYNNMISSSLPIYISKLYNLREFLIQNNKFTGNLNNRFNHTLQRSLSYIDMSNNLLTSTIPSDIFLLSSLQSIVLTSNCFTGYLPSTICQVNKTLVTMLLDGLNSNGNCYHNFFSIINSKGVYGTIPSCLLNMSLLTTLHLSGNDISGTLPDIPGLYEPSLEYPIVHKFIFIPTITNLSDVSFANNRLHGTIPISFQKYNFSKQLLLSNNQLSGTLINDFTITSVQSALSLSVNRLSGEIPSSFLSPDISKVSLEVLSGNIFACNNNNLPQNDPSYKSYSCGSNNVNLATYTFLVVLLATLVVIALLGCIYRYKVYINVVDVLSHMKSYYNTISSDSKSNELLDINQSFDNPIYTAKRNSNLPPISLSSISDITMSTTFINNKFDYLSSYPNSLLFLDSLKWVQLICFTVIILLLIILLPVNLILASADSIYTYQYGWIISMVLQHGLSTACAYMSILFLVLFFIKLSMYIQKIKNEKWLYDHKQLINDNNTTVEAKSYNAWYISKLLLLFLIVQLVNVIITLAVNISYVQDALSDSNLSTFDLICLQVSIGLFKVFWGSTYIPSSYNLLISLGFSSLFSIQSRLLMSLVNYIISPVIATLISNKSCYYYAFNDQPTVDSSFNLPLCPALLGVEYSNTYFCIRDEISTFLTTFQPSFIYSYTCGSALMTAYIPIIFYSYISTGFILPLLRYLFMKSQNRSNENNITIDGIAINVTLMQHLTVLLTFGLSYPVLGVVIGIAIFTESLYYQLLLGYTIKIKLLQVIDIRIDRAWRVINSCSRLVIITVSIYWSMVLFDMIGDDFGAVIGICTVISYILFIVLVVIILPSYVIVKFDYINQLFHFIYDRLLSRFMILTVMNHNDSIRSLGNNSVIQLVIRESSTKPSENFGVDGSYEN